MCGVVGFYSEDPSRSHLLKIIQLFKHSKIRGLHAFGFSVLEKRGRPDGIYTAKFHSLLELEVALRAYELNPPGLLIGHGRYSTSGDYHDHSNNQPIHIPYVSVAFNGVISMKTKEEREKDFHKLYTTDNDGEIIARMAERNEDYATFVKKGKFSFAGLIMKGERVGVLRNKNRPLWCAKYEGGTFIASTKDILRRAGGFETPKEIPPGIDCDIRCL